MDDLRFAARTFAKRPGFTAVAVLTLALRINLLYGTQAASPKVFAVVSLTLLAAAALAMLLPARRAARIDPMIALRDE